MTHVTNVHAMEAARLDRAFEYAVVQSWNELMPDPTSGSIHIEYETGADGSLDFVKVWASTVRGCWNLICEFWVRPLWSHVTGITFAKDYHSADLARTLTFLIEHANAFAKLPDRRGFLQVSPPTEAEREEAQRWTTVAFNHDGALPKEEPVAV